MYIRLTRICSLGSSYALQSSTIVQLPPKVLCWTTCLCSSPTMDSRLLSISRLTVCFGMRVAYLSACEILAADDVLYYCQEGVVYTSIDGVNWLAEDLSAETYVPRVMLMHFNDSVWMVSEHSTNHTFHLSVEDGLSWRTNPEALPANWPLSEFCVVEFTSSSERPRAMILGGYDTQGNGLNSRWNIEYTLANGYRYANFAIEKPLCSAILGASVVYYGKRFYLFGGTDNEAQYLSETALYSDDEGLNWSKIDTVRNRLMDVYSPRTETSAIVENSCIYLIGGQSRTETYSDVLCGKLNSIDW